MFQIAFNEARNVVATLGDDLRLCLCSMPAEENATITPIGYITLNSPAACIAFVHSDDGNPDTDGRMPLLLASQGTMSVEVITFTSRAFQSVSNGRPLADNTMERTSVRIDAAVTSMGATTKVRTALLQEF